MNKITLRIIPVGGLAFALLSFVRAEGDGAAAAGPPSYTSIRYNEDYTYLKDPANRADFFDPIKYIQLGKKGDSYLTFGGEVRDRYEYFENYQFGEGPQDHNGYNLLRLRANADLHLGQNVRFFAEGISATEQGRTGGPRSSDVDEIDLHQGFVEAKLSLADDTGFTLRGGRQNMAFGVERLVGVSDFTNVRRTWDGVRGTLTTTGNTLDLFYQRPVRVQPYQLDGDVPGTFLTGVYDTWHLPAWDSAKPTAEMYALYVQRQSMTFNQTTDEESRYTLGARFTAHPKPFDLDVEPDYQVGRFNGRTTHAFSLAAIAGCTFESARLSPRPFIGFDIASGGSRENPGDAFDQLFPSGHGKFGNIDTIGRQNIVDVHSGLTLNLLEKKPAAQRLTLLFGYYQFWRESTHDAVYTASGTVLRAANGSDAKAIGGEIDLEVNWQVERHLSIYAGYAHFSHGAFIAATGPDSEINFVYAAATVTF